MRSSKKLKAAAIAPFVLAVLQGCGTLGGGLTETTIWQTSTTQPGSSKTDEGLPGNGAKPGMEQADRLMKLASDMQAHGDARASWLSLYEQAVMASGNDPAYMLRLAAIYNDVGQTADALKTYRSLLDRDSSNGAAQMGFGMTLIKTGALDKGTEALAKAAPLLNSPLAYTRLGVAYTQAGKVREACTALETAHKLAPGDLDISTNLALASALAGDYDKSVTLVRAVTASPGVQQEHRYNLVLVLALAGHTDEAREAARQALTQSEADALLARAATIRGLSEPKARAKALGTVTAPAAATTPAAPATATAPEAPATPAKVPLAREWRG
jgi:Flp pilus assembly protein TadD